MRIQGQTGFAREPWRKQFLWAYPHLINTTDQQIWGFQEPWQLPPPDTSPPTAFVLSVIFSVIAVVFRDLHSIKWAL